MSRATLCGVANYPNSDCGVGNFSNSGSVVLAINQYQTLRCLQFLKFRLCGVVNNTEPDSAVLVITQSKTLFRCWQKANYTEPDSAISAIPQRQTQRFRQFRSARLGCIGNCAEYDSAVLLITRMWRACNLITFTPCLTGPVDYPFASCHEGPGFKTPGGYLCETRILLLALSGYIGYPDVIDYCDLV
jgi:hypothetical protein